MAVVKNNPLLEGLSGMLGGVLVYRQMKNPSTGRMMTIVQCAPVRTAPYNEAQKKQQGRFKEAMAYARALLSDPEVKAKYTAKAKAARRGLNAFNVAVSEYLLREPKQIEEKESDNDKLRKPDRHLSNLQVNSLGKLEMKFDEDSFIYDALCGGLSRLVLDSS